MFENPHNLRVYFGKQKSKRDKYGRIKNKLPCAEKWNIITMKVQTNYKGMREKTKMVRDFKAFIFE